MVLGMARESAAKYLPKLVNLTRLSILDNINLSVHLRENIIVYNIKIISLFPKIVMFHNSVAHENWECAFETYHIIKLYQNRQGSTSIKMVVDELTDPNCS